MKNLFAFIAFLCTAWLTAQTGAIVGKLTDKELNDDPLAFANILIKGTTTGTTSDFDGLYEIPGLEPGTYVVVYSYLGYETIEIPNVVVKEVTKVVKKEEIIESTYLAVCNTCPIDYRDLK